jgi:hypothetical protein
VLLDPHLNCLSRTLGRRAFLRVAAIGGGALYVAGCGSSDDGGDATNTPADGDATATPGGGVTSVQPVLLGTEYVAGAQSRFILGLLDAQNDFLSEAAVSLRFFRIGADGRTGEFAFEAPARYLEMDVEGAHTHDGSSGETVTEERVPFYVADVPFDAAGRWGAEVASTLPGESEAKSQLAFDVLAEPQTPADGTTPPASQNDTAATNANVQSLCSRDPICGLHDLVIGDVLGDGRPLVVQFSTPAFCETRFCGPVLEALLTQVPAYRDRIDFVHVEVFQDFQLQRYRPAVTEWGLTGEPYTFFVGGDGTVRGRFEAIFTIDELRGRLDALLVG